MEGGWPEVTWQSVEECGPCLLCAAGSGVGAWLSEDMRHLNLFSE